MELIKALELVMQFNNADGIIINGKAYRVTADDIKALETVEGVVAAEIAKEQ